MYQHHYNKSDSNCNNKAQHVHVSQTSQPWNKPGREKFKPPTYLHAAGKPCIVHTHTFLNNVENAWLPTVAY